MVFSVCPNRRHRTSRDGFHALCQLLRCLRLLADVVAPTLIVSGEILWGEMLAHRMVEALAIHVKLARNILGISLVPVWHKDERMTPNDKSSETARQRGVACNENVIAPFSAACG